jgi:hypothetical protein
VNVLLLQRSTLAQLKKERITSQGSDRRRWNGHGFAGLDEGKPLSVEGASAEYLLL